MPPSLALFLWLVLLVALLRFDPARDSRNSPALWVPVTWMFIIGSRLPSQWLGGRGQLAQTLEEGNALDRTVSSALILLAIVILMSRSFKLGKFFTRNLALAALLSFGFISVLWSDFPFVALKRCFRDLGSYLVILVALSDPRPLEAVRVLLRRLCYLLIPLSVVLVKYYPDIGRRYGTWTGAAEYIGAATSKNMLGVACLISGLFFFWDTVTRWSDRKERRTRQIIRLNIAFVVMTLWLLNMASSATSSVCLVLGCAVIAAAHRKVLPRHLLHALIPVCLCLYLVLAFVFNINSDLAGALGRDPTLTDRTKLWELLLSMHTNVFVGTGYQSFWLGSRLQPVWQIFPGLNEAHNGYLEVYLNLGLFGLLFVGGFLIASYRNICKKFASSPSLACLALAVWTILIFYNMTEAAFQVGSLWLILLTGAVAVPERGKRMMLFEDASATERTHSFPLENSGFRGRNALG